MTHSDRLVVLFAYTGHFVTHVLLGLFLTLVIVIGADFGSSYSSLISLWAVGVFLIGLGAPIAGWLADRVGEAWMMVAFYVGAGASCVAAAAADDPLTLQCALAALGLFSSIYHPVGMSWVVRHTQSRGTAMGFLGICGSIGVAASGVIAGSISDLAGWRVAFAIPGLISVVIGLTLGGCIAFDIVQRRHSDIVERVEPSKSELVWAFAVLAVTMFCGSIFYNAFVTALPKWVELEIGPQLPGTLTGIGTVVALIYLLGSVSQLVGGRLSDKISVRWLYVLSFMIKAPIVALAGVASGWTILPVALLVVLLIDLGAPVENILLARYSPKQRRGLSYGIKHAMGLVAGPIGVLLVANVYQGTGDFSQLFLMLAGLQAFMLVAAFFLPMEKEQITKPSANLV